MKANQRESKDRGLRTFARKAGVRIVDAGGYEPFHYTQKGYPNTTVGGFRSENAAYKHWLVNTFTEPVARAIINLIRRAA